MPAEHVLLLHRAQRVTIAYMIQSFRHKGLKKFFESGSVAGIQPHHAKRLHMLLAALNTAHTLQDMDVSGFRLHPLGVTSGVAGRYGSMETGA